MQDKTSKPSFSIMVDLEEYAVGLYGSFDEYCETFHKFNTRREAIAIAKHWMNWAVNKRNLKFQRKKR